MSSIQTFLRFLPFLYLVFAGCSPSRPARADAVDVADSANNARASQAGFDKVTAGFLVDAADARMMDIKEGRAATRLGLDPAVRNYGRLMLKEHSALLLQLRKLANSQHIVLPAEISDSKKESFSQLAELTGDAFDDKFIGMMMIDHSRDVSAFQQARTLPNGAVAAFAAEKLPGIQRDLDRLTAIRDKRKK